MIVVHYGTDHKNIISSLFTSHCYDFLSELYWPFYLILTNVDSNVIKVIHSSLRSIYSSRVIISLLLALPVCERNRSFQ